MAERYTALKPGPAYEPGALFAQLQTIQRVLLDTVPRARPYRTVAAAYTIQRTDHTILCDATAGAFTVTLPPAAPSGAVVYFPKVSGVYWVPGVAPSSGLLALTKSVTLQGAYRGVTVKFGPEQPSTGGIVCWKLSSGVDVVVEDLTLHGPEKNNDQLHRAFGWSAVDTTTGALVAGAESTRMGFYWSKVYDGPVRLDGTGGHDAVPFSIPGNLWVYGIMEAE